jgi:ribosomal protein S18 acetylase RimI-like enzyme
VKPLRPDQREAAAETLAAAFLDDPLLELLAPDPARRASVGRWFFRTQVDYGQRWGHVWAAGDVAAVSVWLPPGTRFDPLRSLCVGMGAFPFRVGWRPMRRVIGIAPALERLHRSVRGPHWYLMTLGTRPSRQGEGLGSAVLTAGTAQADVNAVPCYLETATQRAIDFYLRHGFEVVNREDVQGHVLYGLVRPARKATGDRADIGRAAPSGGAP